MRVRVRRIQVGVRVRASVLAKCFHERDLVLHVRRYSEGRVWVRVRRILISGVRVRARVIRRSLSCLTVSVRTGIEQLRQCQRRELFSRC